MATKVVISFKWEQFNKVMFICYYSQHKLLYKSPYQINCNYILFFGTLTGKMGKKCQLIVLEFTRKFVAHTAA